jgi:hypothetical protein
VYLGRPTAGHLLSKSGLEGSTPSRPGFRWRVAQRTRAGDFGSQGCGFKSCHASQLDREAQSEVQRSSNPQDLGSNPSAVAIPRSRPMVRIPRCERGDRRSTRRPRTTIRPVAKTRRHRIATPTRAGLIPARAPNRAKCPVCGRIWCKCLVFVAQLAAHRPFKSGVVGSYPTGDTSP